ncbi:ras-like protein [Antechinus flavipes]|uniref:ras-like protein n=1 Tax=Antechinus flavipes TaxID=38775 RepID=UPI00223667BF|nr:ras-like protein [Antechinus flavipes]
MASCVHTSIGDPDRRRIKMYKLVVMGTGSVGKTALTIQFTKNRFVTQHDPTIQDFYCKKTVVDKERCQLHIVDTTGTEEYYLLRNHSVHWGEGFLLVYAVNDPHSFENVNLFWDRLWRLKGTAPVPVVLVANKIDVTDSLVDPTWGKEMARRLGVPYVEASAKTGQGVEQAFHELVCEIRRIRAEEEEVKSHPNTEQKEASGSTVAQSSEQE